MRVLITGASSLPGYRLTKLLVNRGYDVLGLYNKNVIPIEHSNLRKERVDVLDYDSLNNIFEGFRPDVVVHMAAYGDVDGCERDKYFAWKVNVEGTRNVVYLVNKYSNYLLYLSTDYVFDGIKGFYNEYDPPDPINYYGLTKLMGEVITLSSVIRNCVVRASSIYGFGPGRMNFAKFLINKLKANEEVRALTDQYTTPTQASLLAEALCEIIENRYSGVLHVVGERLSRYEFAVKVAEKFGFDRRLIKPATMDEFKWFAPRPRDSSLNCEATKKIIKVDFYSLSKALNIFKSEYEEGL